MIALTSPPVWRLLVDQGLSFLAMGGLVILSAFFSGSETALFSLTGFERLELRSGPGRFGRVVDRLLRRPQRLLLTILVANMAVNILIFTIAGIVSIRLGRSHAFLASAVGLGALMTVVLFGEILPKAVAFHLRTSLSKVSAVVLWPLCQILNPVMAILRWLIVVPAVRLLAGPAPEREIQKEELLQLLDTFVREDLVQSDQVTMLKNAIDLKDSHVRRIMKPRVDLVCRHIDESADRLRELIREDDLPLVLVYRENRDNVVGLVRTRRLVLEQRDTVAEIVEPVHFVPEQQRVDQLVHFFRETDTDVAVVIDEYGGLVGLVQMEDVIEELLGSFAPKPSHIDVPRIQEISPHEYLADGALPIGVLCRQFDVPIPQTDVDTVGGLVMNLLGHLPEESESVKYHHLTLQASEILRSKIVKVTIVDPRDRGAVRSKT